MRKIPATMASQHPDHAQKPYWHPKTFISTRSEVNECFLTFSDLGVSEYKWDWEGKFVDESVVEHLFSEHFAYFKKFPLGKEKFLTFRLPNPKVETEFRLSRAFMGILGASALAKQIGLPTPVLFEVILPMTESADEMISVQEAFRELTSLKHPLHKLENGVLKNLEIIPLFEQVQTIIHSDQIIRDYLTLHKILFKTRPKYLRPYVARSDPALNSGLVPTVLAIKIALSRYLQLEKEENIKLYPIIGSASLPFRGGLTPETTDNFMSEYRGIKTLLLQSAFRYDYPKDKVIKVIKKIEENLPKLKAVAISKKEELELRKIIPIFEFYYHQTIEGIAYLVNDIARFLPARRERVQHIGLFGYSRGVGNVKLPRAIGFTASLYSIGIPPELIGTGRGLTELTKLKKIKLVEKFYRNLKSDLLRAGRYLNKKVLSELKFEGINEDIIGIEKYLGQKLKPETDKELEHQKLTREIFRNLKNRSKITDLIEQAAVLRQSLG